MNEFIKVPELSGREKAAILISELGSANTDRIFSHLSGKEVESLLSAVGALKNVSVHDEIRVLEEVNRFGVSRGIAQPVRSDAEIKAELDEARRNGKYGSKQLQDLVSQNPDAIANALSAWMRED